MKRRFFFIATLSAAALGAYLALVMIGNRMAADPFLVQIGAGSALPPAAGEISVMTWNVGYGGLGAESDFAMDGGKMYLPPSGKAVRKNVDGIKAELGAADADVILLQETARASLLTRGADVLGAVGSALAGRDNAFSADFSARFLPPFLTPRNGLFSSVGRAGAARELVALPLEPKFYLGLTQRRYHMHVIRLPAQDGPWTIINIHLSAFDEGANVRLAQLRAVLAFAQAEHETGARVVIGGDWNYEFARPDLPSTTAEEFQFWIHPFPFEELPDGWRAVFDAQTPSVRTNEKPYVRGENLATVIDGFVISPDVVAVSVAARDLDFEISDHHPVLARFRGR